MPELRNSKMAYATTPTRMKKLEKLAALLDQYKTNIIDEAIDVLYKKVFKK